MSDQIRSISQNNFLLADQKEVSHDNTLSGNGTEASPLGLNETVLFESRNGSVTSFTTSEPIENFSEIWFYVKGGEGTNIPVAKAILPMGFTDYSENIAICYGAPYSITGNIAITWTTRFSRSGNTFTFTSSYFGGGFGTTANAGGNNNIGWVYKVVGINRIANN